MASPKVINCRADELGLILSSIDEAPMSQWKAYFKVAREYMMYDVGTYCFVLCLMMNPDQRDTSEPTDTSSASDPRDPRPGRSVGGVSQVCGRHLLRRRRAVAPLQNLRRDPGGVEKVRRLVLQGHAALCDARLEAAAAGQRHWLPETGDAARRVAGLSPLRRPLQLGQTRAEQCQR